MAFDIRLFARQARHAVGGRGLILILASGTTALLCCAITVADIALSLQSTRVAERQHAAQEIDVLDVAIREVVHNGLAMASGFSRPADGRSPMQTSWTHFQSSLDAFCGRLGVSAAQAERLRDICQTRADFYRDVTPEIDAFNPPDHPIERRIGLELLGLREEISGSSQLAAAEANRLIEQMATDYRKALWILAISTTGLFGAALVLLVLFGSVSTRYHDQWRQTRQASDLLRETLEALPAGVVLFDRDERLMMFNGAATCSTPLLKRPGVIGIKYEELALETAKLAGEFGNPLINTPEQWIARFRSKGAQRMRQSVGERWFEWSERLTASGRTVGLRVDITDLKNHEIKLEAAHVQLEAEMRRLRSVIESSGASMVLTDRDLRILLVNREFADLHGLTVEEAVGRPLGDIVGITLDRSVLDKWLSGPLASGDIEVIRYSKTKVWPDGVPRFYNLTAKPVTDETGFVRQIVFLSVDDTERREVEQALADADRLATVGEMAATVVHEISQPLQVINLAAASALDEVAEAAERGNIGDAAYLKGRLERITQQVERAASIINDLRGFVRSTFIDKVAPFDVAEAVCNAVDLASHTLRRSRITLLSRIGEGVPPVVGHCSRLEQVLINLINNARDAGASTIEVFADTMQHEGRRFVRLAVEDTGPGISQEVLPRLFRKFVTNKPRGKGTGLGLRICRRIVEEMGGTIAAGNRPEGGARFEILLPAVDAVR